MRALPEKANAARAGGGAAKVKKTTFRNNPNTNTKLVSQLQSARDQLDTLEQLALWKLDLQARLWRERQAFMFAGTERDFGHLADEVADFKRVAKAHAWKGGAP